MILIAFIHARANHKDLRYLERLLYEPVFFKQNHPSRRLRLDIPSAVALRRRLSMTQSSYSVIQKTQSTFHTLYLPQYAVSHLVLIEATLPSWIHTDMKWVLFCLLWHSGGVQFASLFSTFFHSSAIQEHTITIITPAVSLIKINCDFGPLTMSPMADLHSCKSQEFSILDSQYSTHIFSQPCVS